MSVSISQGSSANSSAQSGQSPGVKSVLVVLSPVGQAFDRDGLRNLMGQRFPGAAVFFESTSGDPVGAKAPRNVDLAIDFTPSGARQSLAFPFRLKSRAQVVVARRAARFRSWLATQTYDETTDQDLPKDYLERETEVQRRVLMLAGIALVRQGGVGQDLGKSFSL